MSRNEKRAARVPMSAITVSPRLRLTSPPPLWSIVAVVIDRAQPRADFSVEQRDAHFGFRVCHQTRARPRDQGSKAAKRGARTSWPRRAIDKGCSEGQRQLG